MKQRQLKIEKKEINNISWLSVLFGLFSALAYYIAHSNEVAGILLAFGFFFAIYAMIQTKRESYKYTEASVAIAFFGMTLAIGMFIAVIGTDLAKTYEPKINEILSENDYYDDYNYQLDINSTDRATEYAYQLYYGSEFVSDYDFLQTELPTITELSETETSQYMELIGYDTSNYDITKTYYAFWEKIKENESEFCAAFFTYKGEVIQDFNCDKTDIIETNNENNNSEIVVTK